MASDLIAQPMREIILTHGLVKAMQLAKLDTIALDLDDLQEVNLEVQIHGDVAVFRLVSAEAVAKAKADGASVITCEGTEMMPWAPEEGEGNA